MGLGRFVLRRIAYSIVLIFSVIVFNFLLIHMAPGDPALTLAGEAGGTTPEILAEIRATYGLDKTLMQQLLVYANRMARGDMGVSFYYNESVFQLILQRVPATLLLVIVAELLAVLVGAFLGIIAAKKPYGCFSSAVTIISVTGFSTPVFWLGLMLIILFGYLIPIFPSFGMRTVGLRGGATEQYFDILDRKSVV
jgi:peptide/nickel transport system permease protein